MHRSLIVHNLKWITLHNLTSSYGKIYEIYFHFISFYIHFSVRHGLRRAQDTGHFKDRQIQTHYKSIFEKKSALAFLKPSVHCVTKKEKLRKAINCVELFSDEETLILFSCKDNSASIYRILNGCSVTRSSWELSFKSIFNSYEVTVTAWNLQKHSRELWGCPAAIWPTNFLKICHMV